MCIISSHVYLKRLIYLHKHSLFMHGISVEGEKRNQYMWGRHQATRDQDGNTDFLHSAWSFEPHNTFQLYFFKKSIYYLFILHTHLHARRHTAVMALEFAISLFNHLLIQSANTYPASLFLFCALYHGRHYSHRVKSVLLGAGKDSCVLPLEMFRSSLNYRPKA